MQSSTIFKILDEILGVVELSRPVVDNIVATVKAEHPSLDVDALNAKFDVIDQRGQEIIDTANAEIDRAKADAASGEQNLD